MTLNEGQYELNGYCFGAGTAVTVLQGGDDLAESDVRDQDVDRAQADGVLFGREYQTAPIRTFIVMVECDDAVSELARLRSAHRWDAGRVTPLGASTLRWRRDGVTYRAIGRGRKFHVLERGRPTPKVRFAEFTFAYRDPHAYLDQAGSIELSMVASSLATPLTLPCVLPCVLGTIGRGHVGVADVTGLAAVPFTATIVGPQFGTATNLRMSGPGWLLDFGALTLAAGQTITVDTSGVGSALRGGISVAGALSRSSTLTGRLRPGVAEFAFSASDPSSTVRAVVSWRPAALIT